MQHTKTPIVTVFAATDPTGGAGIISDCRTLTANNCLPLAVITAITAQNLTGVQAVWQLTTAQIQAQCLAIQNAPPAAIKIGVIGRAANALLAHFSAHQRIVWDPVISPTTGKPFITPTQHRSLCRRLLPQIYVITPNRRELLQLADEKRVITAVGKLLQQGTRHVLVTDIDGRGKTVKHALFCGRGKTALWEAETPRLPETYHGSGCFFSTTLTAALAHDKDIITAAKTAQTKTILAIENARTVLPLGKQRLLY